MVASCRVSGFRSRGPRFQTKCWWGAVVLRLEHLPIDGEDSGSIPPAPRFETWAILFTPLCPVHDRKKKGATYCPRVRERVSRPGGGVISIMLFRIL